MSEILFHYQKINPATWVYLSSLLMIGLFFQFNRFWSVRNLDLVLLILLAPGLLMVNQAREETAASASQHHLAAAPASEADATPLDEAAQRPPATAPSGVTKLSLRDQVAYAGYLWLFAVSLIWLVRMLADPTMVRRPLLEPNASKG